MCTFFCTVLAWHPVTPDPAGPRSPKGWRRLGTAECGSDDRQLRYRTRRDGRPSCAPRATLWPRSRPRSTPNAFQPRQARAGGARAAFSTSWPAGTRRTTRPLDSEHRHWRGGHGPCAVPPHGWGTAVRLSRHDQRRRRAFGVPCFAEQVVRAVDHSAPWPRNNAPLIPEQTRNSEHPGPPTLGPRRHRRSSAYATQQRSRWSALADHRSSRHRFRWMLTTNACSRNGPR